MSPIIAVEKYRHIAKKLIHLLPQKKKTHSIALMVDHKSVTFAKCKLPI